MFSWSWESLRAYFLWGWKNESLMVQFPLWEERNSDSHPLSFPRSVRPHLTFPHGVSDAIYKWTGNQRKKYVLPIRPQRDSLGWSCGRCHPPPELSWTGTELLHGHRWCFMQWEAPVLPASKSEYHSELTYEVPWAGGIGKLVKQGHRSQSRQFNQLHRLRTVRKSWTTTMFSCYLIGQSKWNRMVGVGGSLSCTGDRCGHIEEAIRKEEER
jgi:hypothetical protein